MSHLTQEQRYTICAMNNIGSSQKDIALAINKHKSVVSRELRRNCDQRNGQYKSELAGKKYMERLKAKPRKISFTPQVRATVDHWLGEEYSPEQVVGHCLENGLPCVSVERIYQYVWQDKKQGGQLYLKLRNKGKRYRKRGNSKDSRGILKGRRGIEQRPLEVELKERVGDLEIDTIIGKNHKGAIVTINDRATGILRMKKVAKREAPLVKEATIELLREWKPLLHTITADNGKEFAMHQAISQELEVDFFFARPYHSWERGANENLNGLIRQYIPKASDFDDFSDEQIYQIQEKLNNRPRKRYNFKSPNQLFNQKVAFDT
jgi:transposase, IS30 family